MRSSRLFSRTVNATCASATVSQKYLTDLTAASNVPIPSDVQFSVCERTTRKEDGVRTGDVPNILTDCFMWSSIPTSYNI